MNTTTDRARRQRDAIQTIVPLLQDEGIRFWVIGGWAVDLHLGRITRPHSDVDLAVDIRDRPGLSGALAACGYRSIVDESPTREVFAGDEVVELLEITYLAETGDGAIVTPGFEFWPHAAGSFGEDRIELAGCSVPVMSVAGLLDVKEQWLAHLGEPMRPHDHADVARLRAFRPLQASSTS